MSQLTYLVKKIIPVLFSLSLIFITLSAQANSSFELASSTQTIVVDGQLDEKVWKNATKMQLSFENRPGEGTPASVKTEVYLFENGQSLNIAIKAFDPHPEKIRASLRDRDELWDDDNVGIVIDTFNDKRSGYEFFVNALGAQADMRLKDSNGWNEDDSWDAIWDSAGRITQYGYVVEMSIPFNALRFPKRDGSLIWNIALMRNYPRDTRTQFANYKRDRNIKCNICQFDQLIGFKHIKQGNNFQLTPTLTISRADKKTNVPGAWDNGKVKADPGVDVRWGISQDMVLNATLNPDFSQVEADAGQLDINNTFSLFFPEKRPFFLDGASYFDTSSFNLVHTRNIAEPDYGLKLTGKSNDHSYGLMVTNDKDTAFLIPGNQGSSLATLGKKSNVMIARYKKDVGERSNVGVLITHRDATDYNNTVTSVDGDYWFSQADSIRYQMSYSDSENPDDVQDDFDLDKQQQGNAISLGYAHKTRDYNIRVDYRNVSKGFRADLGFFTKVDYQKIIIGGRRKWFGDKDDVLTQWGYFGDWDKSYDQDGNLLEEEYELHGNIQGPMQLYSNFGVVTRKRLYNDIYFDESQFRAFGKVTPLSGLTASVFTRFGTQIDFSNTQLGHIFAVVPKIRWDVNMYLSIRASHDLTFLNVQGQRLFTANQSDVRFSYQFDMRSKLKLVLQYTDIERTLSLYDPADDLDKNSKSFATQLIYSYKINPQTLFFVGYSDGGFQDDDLTRLERDKRAIFTKFSYAWQI
jgi:hypothetical protein